MKRKLLGAVWAAWWLTVATAAAVTEHRGQIDGANFHLLAPETWNGRLWIEAHGLRQESSPLVAELSPRLPFNRALLDAGWALATTSYRRNGLIVADALEDVRALRQRAIEILGEPRLTVVEGSSMGGAIATLLAERHPDEFSAVVAAGAALQVRDPRAPDLAPTGRPRVPIVFLTNRSELEAPAGYVARVRDHRKAGVVAPVLWTVQRDGHVNVNAAERLAALSAAVAWVETGQSPGDRADATLAPDPGPTTAVFAADGNATGRVLELSRVHGNLYTDFQPADLARLGIAHGGDFVLRARGGEVTVRFATTYGDVPRGEWVAFPTADGQVMIARNRANAAETLGLGPGDEITILPAAR